MMSKKGTERHNEKQKQFEREARIQTARQHAKSSADLARTMGDEGWEKAEKDLCDKGD